MRQERKKKKRDINWKKFEAGKGKKRREVVKAAMQRKWGIDEAGKQKKILRIVEAAKQKQKISGIVEAALPEFKPDDEVAHLQSAETSGHKVRKQLSFLWYAHSKSLVAVVNKLVKCICILRIQRVHITARIILHSDSGNNRIYVNPPTISVVIFKLQMTWKFPKVLKDDFHFARG
jgi:hypothetical protein